MFSNTDPPTFLYERDHVSVMAKWCQILELVLAYLRNKDWVTVEATIEQMELTKEMGMNVQFHRVWYIKRKNQNHKSVGAITNPAG
jgi:hypothetical protein